MLSFFHVPIRPPRVYATHEKVMIPYDLLNIHIMILKAFSHHVRLVLHKQTKKKKYSERYAFK